MLLLRSILSVALALLVERSFAQVACPAFPNPRPVASSLPALTTLPDPFTYFNSTRRVTSVEDWYNCRQPEIKRILQEYQFGFYPDSSAESVSSSRSGTSLTVTVTAGGKSGSVRATLTLPAGASAASPVPVMIGIGGVDNAAYTRAGIAVATLDYTGVAPDGTGKTGAFWALYNGQDIGVLTAWAWGVHRVLDGIEKSVPEIDPKRTAVTGCSRLGKAALAAGLFDTRILITVPMSSGIQGLGPYRYWQLSGQGENLENSKQGAPWWTCNVISGFLNNHERLPYDSHLIAAAIAPRYLVADEGQSDPYVNARGTGSIVYPAAREVYKFLGVTDRIGMAIRTGGHCENAGHGNVMPFLQKVFSNVSTSRDYNNLSPWTATTTAYPWASNIPTATIPSTTVTTPTSTITSTTTTTSTTSTSTITTAPTVLPTSGPCSAKYGQCGGTGYTGPTCCVAGSTCTKLNDFYYQCT